MKPSLKSMHAINPLFRLILCLALLLSAAPFQAGVARSASPDTAYHTITIDGDLSDWSADELMELDGGNALYFTWDLNHLYLGLSGVTLGDDPAQDKSFFVCLDTVLTPGAGAGADGYTNVSFNRSFFAPEYCYYFAGAGGWYEWSSWNGTSWTWNPWRNDGSYYNWSGNPAALPGSELTILRSDIGSPALLRLAAWVTPEQPVPGPLEASWPSRNPVGGNQVITFPYHFASLGDGIAPNASVNHVTINELRADQSGTDNDEYFELSGPPGYPLTDLTYLVIGDGTGASGVVENVTSLTGSTLPASGFFVAAEATFTLGVADLVVANLNFENDDNVTHLLVSGYTGGSAPDLDADNDGVLDSAPWTQVVDLIALIKEDNPPPVTEYHYGPPTIGPDGSFVPGHAYWCGAMDAWRIGLFNPLGGNDTPNAGNCMADLGILKAATPSQMPGGLVDYTFTLQNPDNLAGFSSVVSDTLPAYVSYQGDDSGFPCPACTIGATGVLTWSVGTLEPNQVISFTVNALLSDTAPLYQTLTNHVSLTSLSPERNPADNTAQAGTYVSPLDLAVDKLGPAYAAIGQPLMYEIRVDNTGVTVAQSVLITDVLPLNTTYLSDSSGITPANPVPGTYVWSVGSLPAGSLFTFNLTTTVITSTLPGSSLVNSLRASTTTPGDDPSNNTAQLASTAYTLLPIHTIQGSAHLSLLDGQTITYTHGIVTALRSNGFYMQDPYPDSDPATSEAIFVFTGSPPAVSVGDELVVSGVVDEYRPGAPSTLTNLTTTELTNPTILLAHSGVALPAPTVLGLGGRIPPSQVIEDDATGDVETSGVFDPHTDGIDFYESLEAMLVQVNDAIAVGPANRFGEIAVVGDNGSQGGVFSPRGGIVIQVDDYNPERILLDDSILSTPQVTTGDSFAAPILGVLDYSFGNFKLNITQPLDVVSGGLISETTSLTRTVDQISVATFNVENLDPNPADGDDDTLRFTLLAQEIVTHLGAPDIVALQEIQDNTGGTDDGVVAADLTYATLIAAILAVGGPAYEYRDISPVNNQDGGQPGANIRVGFLFRPDRGLQFVDRPGGDPLTPVVPVLGPMGVELSFSPGRLDPANSAFNDSRKPLAGEFTFNGQQLILVVNHLNSKGGDDPLFGRFQPPVLSSEAQRLAQAAVLNDFVSQVLALDPQANVIVLGDLNDFQFSAPLQTLAGSQLTILANTLPVEERYSYVYDGNSQELDHILVSDALLASALYDMVHMNAEFPEALQATDHDPGLVRITLPPAQVNIAKSVTPVSELQPGGVVTYTITLSNASAAYASGVLLTDSLPAEVDFGGWIQQNGAVVVSDTITWSGSLPRRAQLTFIFTATLSLEAPPGATVTNTAFFGYANGSGSAAASFTVRDLLRLFLPVINKP